MRNAQNSVRGTSTKTLGAVETRDLLKRISGKGFDPYALQDIKLHSREVALFAAEILRPLRIAAISAELPQLTWLLETTFYEHLLWPSRRNPFGPMRLCRSLTCCDPMTFTAGVHQPNNRFSK